MKRSPRLMLAMALNLAFSAATYLVVSFVRWDLTWPLGIPRYGQIDRAGILVIWALFAVAAAMLVSRR